MATVWDGARWVWSYGVPVVLVVLALGLLVESVVSRPDRAPWAGESRAWTIVVFVVFVSQLLEALSGSRPPFERAWRATAAGSLLLAYGVRTLRWVLAGRPSGGTVPVRRPSDPAAEPPRADYGNPR